MPVSTPQHIIKKYSNRRLYDTSISGYITQDTVKEYVSKGIPFRVVNAKSGEDITRSVLLQIILDEEIMGVPLFTEEALRSIIMMSGSAMRSSFAGFFEQMLPMLQQNNANLDLDNVFPGMQDANDRFRDQLAVLQGMMMGNSFMEHVGRNMDMVGKVNETIVENTAKMINPLGTPKKKPKKKR